MTGANRHIRGGLAIGAVFTAAMLLAPATAAALTGEITRAQVSPDGAHGWIAGAVRQSNACQEPPEPQEPPPPGPGPGKSVPPKLPESGPWLCGWIPYATVGPATQEGGCSSPDRHWPDLGDGIQLVWLGSERRGIASVDFELDGIALQHGVDAPLLCLSAVEGVVEGISCIDVVDFPCPPYGVVHTDRQLDSALLVPSPVSPLTAAPPPIGQVSGKHKRRCRPSRRRGKQVRRLAQRTSAKKKSRCKQSRRRRHQRSTKY